MTMEVGIEKNETVREEVFSKAVRAGKRTYFFDVKANKGNQYYLTITESKKRFGQDGKFFFEKHKLFLYREDFEKFVNGLNEAIAEIKRLAPEEPVYHRNTENTAETANNYADVSFEDLGNN